MMKCWTPPRAWYSGRLIRAKAWGRCSRVRQRPDSTVPFRQKRSYASGEMPIDLVKGVAKVSNTKLNDVFLASCALGLRRYFERTA